jgi:DASS family divalent anion:Na+ symporter
MELTSKNIDLLLKNEIISLCDRISVVKIIPSIKEKKFMKGDIIYGNNSKAENYYILTEGKVRLSYSKKNIDIEKGQFGTELKRYQSTAAALTDINVIVIHKSILLDLIINNDKVKNAMFEETKKKFDVNPKGLHEKKAESKKLIPKIIGWIFTIIIPVTVLFLGYKYKMSTTNILFLTILSATVLMWIFNLVAEFIPGIFAVLSILILGLVPVEAALSGFSSESFFMAMSILGLGTVIVSSGLSYRIILLILKILPNNQFFHNLGILLTGFIITPVLPTINGRATLMAPLLVDMIEALKLEPKKKASNRLAITAFTGITLLSAVFLSSKSVNFIIFGLLPPQIQNHFQWVGWLVAASVTGIVLLILYFITITFIFWNKEKPELSKELVAIQLEALGKMSFREWAAVIGLALFTVSVVTSSLHKIQPSWIGSCLLYILLLFGVLPKSDFKTKIDWPFLMFLGGMTSAVKVMNYLGMDRWIANNLGWMGNYMSNNFMLFVLILTGTVFIIRLVLPISITIVLTATVFIPIASVSGVNEWLIGFIILVIGEMWFFPYQCSYYINFKEILHDKGIYKESTFLRYNLLMNIFKLLAIYISIPFWKFIGVL